MKRKDMEVAPCELCGKPTRRVIQFGKNPKHRHFICKKCRPYVCGGVK